MARKIYKSLSKFKDYFPVNDKVTFPVFLREAAKKSFFSSPANNSPILKSSFTLFFDIFLYIFQ